MNYDQTYAYDVKKYNEITSIFKELVVKNDSSVNLINTTSMMIDDDYIMKNMMDLTISSNKISSNKISSNKISSNKILEDNEDIEHNEAGIKYLSRFEGNQFVLLKKIGKEKDQLITAIYIPSHISYFNINYVVSSKFSRLELHINNLSHTETTVIDKQLYKKYEFVKPYIPFMMCVDNLYIEFNRNESHRSANMANYNDSDYNRGSDYNQNHVYVEYIDLYVEIPDELYSFKCDYTTVPYIHYNNFDDLYPLESFVNNIRKL